MKYQLILGTALLAAGLSGPASALGVQTYGQDPDIWQTSRDQAFRQRGQAGLIEFDRENARRFYGDKYPNLRDLDRQIRIDRAETELDTQERADQVRYGFGRAAVQAGVPPLVMPELRVGSRLPDVYSGRQYVVDDWRGHRLSAPRWGQRWVQVGAEYVLVNRNGSIQAVERSR